MGSQKKSYSKQTLALSSSLLASAALFSGINNPVQAETLDSEELENLYTQYQSITLTEENTDGVEADGEEEDSSLSEAEIEELEFIRSQLIRMIELAGGEALLNQLDVEHLAYEDLDSVFEALLTRQIEEQERVEMAVASVSDESQEVEEQEETVEETDETDEEPVETYSADEEEEVEETEESTEYQEDVEESSETEESSTDSTVEEVEEQEEEVEEEQEEAEEAPEESASASDSSSNNTRTYTVKRGDTLNKIARDHNTTVNELARINNISNPNQISVGQVIQLSGSSQSSSSNANSGSQSNTNTNQSSPTINSSTTPAQFIEIVAPYAQQVAQEHGVYASVMIAQAALESGYGQSGLSLPPNHNLFGIKGSYQGQSVTVQTREYYANTGWVTINDRFKRYPSYAESFVDNALTIRNGPSWNPQYYSGAWVENTNSYRDATAWLQGRYATDPTYASKLNNLIATYNLTQYDHGGSGGTSTPTPPSTEAPSTPSSPSESQNTTSYRVVRGDTLYSIARRNNTSVATLRQLNSLSGDTIYVNQQLRVPSASGGSTETPTPTPSESQGSYTVVRGDTLFSIARRHNTTVNELKSLNSIQSDMIYVGQQLRVPGSSSSSTPQNTGTSEQTSGSYTIVRGDTLFSIARRNNTTVNELKQLNNISSDTIYVGQTIQVPGASSSESTQREESTPSASTYSVARGDTLFSIARRHNTTVSAIRELNQLSSDTIYVGQELRLTSSSNQSQSTSNSGSSTSSQTHVVERGDTLYSIARRSNLSVNELKTLNNLSSDVIYVGQQLRVSESTGSSTGSQSSNTPSQQGSSSTYTVQRGDTLFKIARENNTTVQAIKEANNLPADTIYVGQELKLTGSGNSTSSSQNNQSSQSTGNQTSNTLEATYTVKAGDTLYGIARAYNVSTTELREWNDLANSDIIRIDQELVVRVSSQSNHSSSTGGTYTVASGDTLYRIARELNTTVASLKERNQLQSDVIFVGQTLSY